MKICMNCRFVFLARRERRSCKEKRTRRHLSPPTKSLCGTKNSEKNHETSKRHDTILKHLAGVYILQSASTALQLRIRRAASLLQNAKYQKYISRHCHPK